MEDHGSPKHPGPWRVMRVDSEFAGLLVAVGFLVLGLVSMPIATAFVLGTIALGVIIALLLRFVKRKSGGGMVGTLIILVPFVLWLAPFVLWWNGHTPKRPRTVSSNALYVIPNNLPSRLLRTGYWLECWFDQHENVDRCKLTDGNGIVSFEDVFVTCKGTPLPQNELVIKPWTGHTWTQSRDKRANSPVVYLPFDQVLIPRSLYAEYCHGS